jgi:hypothetical protein
MLKLASSQPEKQFEAIQPFLKVRTRILQRNTILIVKKMDLAGILE